MTRRRLVRLSDQFFDRLELLFSAERSASGEPSATDFLLHDMTPVIERLAVDFEGSTVAVPGAELTRVLIASGVLVAHLAAYAELLQDGSIEVFYLDID